MRLPNKYNGHQPDGRRLYFKGGDPGRAAQEQEDKRQARIAAATQRINNIFDSGPVTKGRGVATGQYDPTRTYYTSDGAVLGMPKKKVKTMVDAQAGWTDEQGNAMPMMIETDKEVDDMDALRSLFTNGQVFEDTETVTPTNRAQLYEDQKKAVYELNARDVEKQFGEATRQNKFGLARAGLAGGSADIDSHAQLQEKNNEGLMRATGLADAAASDLKMADERARQGLLSMAQSGIDTGDAQQMALRSLDATAQAAQGNRTGATIGNLFGDMSQAYLMRQGRAGQLAGMQQNPQQNYGAGSTRQNYSGAVS